MWRIANLFCGTGLSLLKVGSFQRRRYGPFVLDGAAWALSAETPGHLQPFCLGTFVRFTQLVRGKFHDRLVYLRADMAEALNLYK